MKNTIQYNLTIEDIANLQLYMLKNKKKGYLIWKIISSILIMSIFTTLLYLIVFIVWTNNDNQVYFKYFILWIWNFYLLITSLKKYDKWVLEKLMKNLRDKDLWDIIWKKELIIQWDTLIDTSNEYKINAVQKEEDTEYIYLIISDISVLLLPKRDLSTDEIKFLESKFRA